MSGLEAHGLRDDAAESVELDDVVELLAICRGSGSEQDRVLKSNAAEVDAEPAVSLNAVGAAHCPTALLRRW